ncbi:MAG: DUF1294 domain-containing protein [Desulforhopalus sp.]|nr:DUF1294 domain-containing protein [Desulforhopalus sp.]
MRQKGKIIKWQRGKGFGFIQPVNGKPDIFFHENCFVNQSRDPVVGDEVSFTIATSPEGKPRAERILFRGERDPRRWDHFFDIFYSSLSVLFFFCIGYFVISKQLAPVILIAYLLLSIFTFVLYWWDKRKAQNDQRRTPEKILHFFSMIGGWPGALIAQRWLHHKSRKVSFQVVFYLTVLLNVSAISLYLYSASHVPGYQAVQQKFNVLTSEFTKSSQNTRTQKQQGPVYSWTNKDGKRVYSNVGFPTNEPYRDGKIEWQ